MMYCGFHGGPTPGAAFIAGWRAEFGYAAQVPGTGSCVSGSPKQAPGRLATSATDRKSDSTRNHEFPYGRILLILYHAAFTTPFRRWLRPPRLRGLVSSQAEVRSA